MTYAEKIFGTILALTVFEFEEMVNENRKNEQEFMRQRIPERNWQNFFEQLNETCGGWKTSLRSAHGKEKFSFEKLTLAALVFVKRNGQTLIELIAGDNLANHRAYTIFEPQKIVLTESGNISILIKDSRTAKTSISLIQPKIRCDFPAGILNH